MMKRGRYSDEDVRAMRKDWLEGHTAEAIGRTYGFTKNTVIGLAYRHGWPSRRGERKRDTQDRKIQEEIRPPARTCQWPHGDPYSPGFRFCGGPVVAGHPYCDDHCKRAYTNYGEEDEIGA